ncbi:MAG: hypothetical protein K9J37_12210 [Saprospiraceae bacterium]|nr:hypothetical protein [Saprospiraceae bacterium]MCF8250673.1 hypothetical protein [Saprospiraceae bacterium]MCF8280811.1 hypothetical protein [Bacteroidales bacterium]MCF8312525.1 hypothetical protein [Saprospiraceae bacterium]MCF8440795.1 hypothetical protein [Saprospiraceae bacterium]
MLSQSTYHSKEYRDFRAIEPGDWRGIIHFYEKNETAIRGLDFEEYFELLLGYADALFEIGAWQKHLLMADVVIETSVMENLPDFNGREVFRHSLFRKAASHFNLLELHQAEHVLRELLRIAPHDTDCAAFLQKCLRTMQPWLVRQTRAMAVLLFFVAAFGILLEILVIHNFYETWTSTWRIASWGSLGLGLVVLAGGEVFHRRRCRREVERFLQKVERRKKS